MSRLVVTLMLAAVASTAGPRPVRAQETRAADEPCLSCHPDMEVDVRRSSVHADAMPCLTCHHVGFSNDPAAVAEARLAECRDCHSSMPPAHGELGDQAPECTQCHTLHPGPEDCATATGPAASDTCDPMGGPAHTGGGQFVLFETCQGCHTEIHLSHGGVAEGAPACTQCHVLHGEDPLAETRAEVVSHCRACHTDVHLGHSAALEAEEPSCTECHDVHPTGDPHGEVMASRNSSCVTCHEDASPDHDSGEGTPTTCLQCHAIGTDPPMAEAAPVVARRCGTCHVEALAGVEAGGHGASLADEPNPDLPTCLACHSIHGEGSVARTDPRVSATQQCVSCHSQTDLADRYGIALGVGGSYLDDFHGATAAMQEMLPDDPRAVDVMVCADCHGAHQVTWEVSEAHLASVCLSCHTDADPSIAGAWLGHAEIGPRNKFIIWGLRLFYYGMIPFVLTGLAVSIFFDLRAQQKEGASLGKTRVVQGFKALVTGKPRPESEPEVMVPRFSVLERLEHAGAAISFLLLVGTGLPQAWPGSALGSATLRLFGGIGTMRLVHRVTGVIFVVLMVLHLSRALAAAMRDRRMPIMTLQKKDFLDAYQTLRHYAVGEPKPKSGKFDFREKFEYWGLLLGGTVMTVTGIMLLFPELASQVLPGILIAAGRVAHGLEATFAVLVVVLWHSYGVIFRPEVFPLDKGMFHGKISLERLKEEHALEYERLFPGDGSE